MSDATSVDSRITVTKLLGNNSMCWQFTTNNILNMSGTSNPDEKGALAPGQVNENEDLIMWQAGVDLSLLAFEMEWHGTEGCCAILCCRTPADANRSDNATDDARQRPGNPESSDTSCVHRLQQNAFSSPTSVDLNAAMLRGPTKVKSSHAAKESLANVSTVNHTRIYGFGCAPL